MSRELRRRQSLGAAAAAVGLFAAAFASGGRARQGPAPEPGRGGRQARQALESRVRDDPRDSKSAFLLGRSYYLDRDEDRAVAWLEKAAQIDPARSEYQLWLGRAYGAQALRASVLRQPALAEKVHHAFERAVELDGENLAARLSLLEYDLRAPGFLGGSLQKARAQAQEIRRRDALKGHRALGMIAEHEKKFDVAASEYERAEAEFPEAAEPLSWRAELAESRRDDAAAFELYEKLARERSDPEGLYQVGRLSAATGKRLDRGEACLKLYLDSRPGPDQPSPASAHYRLGLIYEREKIPALARREFLAALEADPLLTEARQALAKLK